MAFDNIVIPGEITGSFLPDPQLRIPQAGILDILSPNFGNSFGSYGEQEDPVKKGLMAFRSAPATSERYAAPTYFNWEKSRADRYINSENYRTFGVDPAIGEENEFKYGRAQTWGDVWSNGLTGMVKLAGNTFVEGWKGWGHMANALSSWDSSKLVGTEEELRQQDKITKGIMDKYAIFDTPESQNTIFNRKLFGDMLQQSGFAVGTIGQFLSEELLTFGLATGFSLSKLGIKSSAWAGKVVTKADLAADLTKLGEPVVRSRSVANSLVQGARKFVPFAGTAYDIARYNRAGAGALQIAAIGVGGVRRSLAEANMAFTEARMEAAGTYAELYDKLFDEELTKNNGELPSVEALENIKAKATAAASDSFGVNSGILMLTNRLQFDNLFTKFSRGRSIFGVTGPYADDVLKVSGKAAVRKGAQETGEQLTKVYQKGRFGTLGLVGDIAKDFGGRTAAWEASKYLGKNIFKWEATEGIQELFQEGSNVAIQDYYYDLYHGVKGANWSKSIEKGFESQMTTQGMKTFLMGALTGRLISPINFTVGQVRKYGGTSAEERKAREKDIKDNVDIINAFYNSKNPEKIFAEQIASVKVQDRAAKNMEEAIINNDRYEFSNNKDSAFAKLVSASMKTGMFKSLTDTIKNFGEDFNDQEFKEAFGLDKTDDNIASVKEFFNQIADETVNFQENWKALTNKYGDLVMPDIYAEGTPERGLALIAKRALDDAIEILATNNYKATRDAQRAVSIQTEMAQIPNLGSSVAAGFRVAAVPQNTKAEIDLLKLELQQLESVEKKDQATKKIIKAKKEQLAALEDWNDNQAAFRLMGVKQRRKFKKAAKGFERYIRAKNLESNLDVDIRLDQMEDIYENLVDYMQLNEDSKDYIDAYNVLANPKNFVIAHKRIMEAMDVVRIKKHFEHLQEMAKEAQGKAAVSQEETKKHTVVPKPNGKFDVISPKGVVVAKDVNTIEEANNIAVDLDNILAQNAQPQGPVTSGQPVNTGQPPPAGTPPGQPAQPGQPPTSNENPDVPPGLSATAVVKNADKEQGIYLIEDKNKQGGTFYYIVGADGAFPFLSVTLDPEKYLTYDPNVAYTDYVDAKNIFDALVATSKRDNTEYEFAGLKLKAGYILVDANNRRYKVVTKTKPVDTPKGKAIALLQLYGAGKVETFFNLNGFRLESSVVATPVVEDPNAFKLQRVNELLRLYPHQNSGQEDRLSAENRLFDIILNTPKDQLVSGLSIRMVKNLTLGPTRIASDRNGERENRRLQINPESYTIQILFNGTPIAYMPNYDQYFYVTDAGTTVNMGDINRERFAQIFDPGKKNFEDAYDQFKANYKKAKKIFTNLQARLGSNAELSLTLQEAEALDILVPYISSGEYAYVDDKADAKPTLDQLEHKTIEGFTYVIDRRVVYLAGDTFEYVDTVHTNADIESRQRIEKRIEKARFEENGDDKLKNYSRYVAVIELPNGDVKFVEITAPVADTGTLNQIVKDINYQSNELKKNNLSEEKTDPATKKTYREAKDNLASKRFNETISQQVYIAVPNARFTKIFLLMTPKGDIKLEISRFDRKDNKPTKTVLVIRESSTDETKPLDIKDYNDLLDRINRAIDQHNANPFVQATRDKIIKKIWFKLKPESFKIDIPKTGDVLEVLKNMESSVETQIVKNPNISFYPIFRQNTPSSNASTGTPAGSTPAGQTGTAASTQSPFNADVDNISEAPPDIAAAQAEFLKRQAAEARAKKDIAQQLNDLVKRKDELRLIIKEELLKEAEQKGLDKREATRSMMLYNYEADPRIVQVNDQIEALKKSDAAKSALKVSKDLSPADINSINEFKSWMRSNLPEFMSVQDMSLVIENMKKNAVTVGKFYIELDILNNVLNGKILLTKPGYKFAYHEAFHGIFRMLLSDEQIQRYYDIAKRELKQQGKSIATLKKELLESNYAFYSKLSEKDLENAVYEEYLADKFQDWKTNNKTNTSHVNKSLFRRMLDFILNIFKALRRSSELEKFFMSIERGAYKNANVVNNRFTNAARVGITEPALKSIQIGTTFITNEEGGVEEIPTFLSQEEGNILSSTIAAMFHERMRGASLTNFSEQILEDIFLDYALLYDRSTNPYYTSDEFLERFNENPVLYAKALEKVDQKYKVFVDKDLRETLKDSVREHTKVMGYREEMEEETEDELVNKHGSERSSTDNRKETYSIGGYGSFSKELRQYLGTIVEQKSDEFGNEYFIDENGVKTGIPLIEAANAAVLYNGILKAVANTTDELLVLERMRIFARNNPEANKFWTKFSNDVGLIYDEDGNFVDIANKKEANLFQAVVKGFMNYMVEYTFVDKDISKGESRILDATQRGAGRNQFNIWYNAYNILFAEQFYNLRINPETTPNKINTFLKQKAAPFDYLVSLLKKDSYYTDSKIGLLEKDIETIVKTLRNELGISISPLYLKYSYYKKLSPDVLAQSKEGSDIINAFQGVDPITEEDALEISVVVKSGRNLFGDNLDADKLASLEQLTLVQSNETLPDVEQTKADLQEQVVQKDDDVLGAVGRMLNIASGNSTFDEQVSTTSHINANGELVHSHQLPTFSLVRGSQLQSPQFREKLKEDPFLATNYLLNSDKFQQIVDNFKVIRIDGMKDSALTTTSSGALVQLKTLHRNQNQGVTYGEMSDREFLLTLFELYTKTRVITPVEKNKPIFSTAGVFLGVIEASNTGEYAELPVIKAVDRTKQGVLKLTDEALDILFNEVVREYDRITRVQNEINTGVYPEGIIENYHNGDPNNKSNPGLRGLRFTKMKLMLTDRQGGLVEMLEESAKNGEAISVEAEKIIKDQLNEYWLGQGGQLEQLVDDMLANNIIRKNDEGVIINNLLNASLKLGFRKQGKFNEELNGLMNFRQGALEFNIAQVLMNDYINTLSARQLFTGDVAKNFKDDGGIDEVKRHKSENGSGPSSYSTITAPSLGIKHPNKTSFVATYQDGKYEGKYSPGKKSKEDAQMRMTVKALRYTLFGFGRLNQAQAELLDKIERGEDVSVNDIFGEKYKDKDGFTQTRGGSIEYNAQTNSIKLIYSDGKRIIKTSGVILTKALTSRRGKGGKWEALPGREDLHNLREQMEAFEAKNQTITFAVPKSASKGMTVNVASNMGSLTDDNFIEFDNNFWRLQLENPSNKVINTDPTQAKLLILSEQIEGLVVNFMGKEMTLGKVMQSYLKDTEQRLTNNFIQARDEIFDIKGAYRELAKSMRQKDITPMLGRLLKKAVETLEATGADPQTIEFFTPLINNKTGEATQNYDLNHPITLDKFTQLFLAHFSKGVMSEKVPGHSIALLSNEGLAVVKRVIELDEMGQPKRWEVLPMVMLQRDSKLFEESKQAKRYNNSFDRLFSDLKVGDLYIDDLRHNVPEYNDKGEIVGYFSEYMLPPHFREDMILYNKDGSISDAARMAFGVRIPSQDKHSFISIKLVDFMPAFYGSTGVFPQELIEISNADFDIDKLYTHILDTYYSREKGERVAYGTATTKEGKFAEYVLYMSRKNRRFKEKLAELNNIGIKYNSALENYDISGNIEDTPVTKYDNIEDLMQDLNGSKSEVARMKELIALKELGLPSNPDEYQQAVNEFGEQNNGVLNNKILYAKIKLHNNEGMVLSRDGKTPVAFQPAEVDPLINILEDLIEEYPILNHILTEGGVDVDSLPGKKKAQKNNKEGSRNIGPAVNAMLVYAILNHAKIEYRLTNSKGEPFKTLRIDGNNFNAYKYNRAFNSETGAYDGERIAYHISALVQAMTDNAKERLAARLGLNINAMSVVANMVSLGVPLKTAIIFNLQPSVREFYRQLSIVNRRIKTSQERNIRKKEIAKKILKQINSRRSEEVGDRVNYEVTTELLANNIKSNGSNADLEYSIFSEFMSFYDQTSFYDAVAVISKVTQGLGTSNEDIDAIDAKEEMLGLNMNDEDFSKTNVPFDVRQTLRGTNRNLPHNNIVATGLRLKDRVKELEKSVMIERAAFFNKIKDTILANVNVYNDIQNNYDIKLKRDILSYLAIKAYMQYLTVNGKGIKLQGLDNALIYDAEAVARGEDYEDIISAVRSMRLAKPENYFADFLNAIQAQITDPATGKNFLNPKARNGINTVEVNSWAKLSNFEYNKIRDSFIDLYTDPNTRPYVYKLFNYLLVKDGGQFKSGSFIRFMPPAMFKELLDATGAAQKIVRFDQLPIDSKEYVDIFGTTGNQLVNEFVDLFLTNTDSSFDTTIINKSVTIKTKDIPKGFNPQSLMVSKDKVVIDIFGGIRPEQTVEVTDEMGNTFMLDKVKNTGDFTEDEKKSFGINLEVLEAAGFDIVSKDVFNEKEKKMVTGRFVQLPYVIKVNFSKNRNIDGDQFVYFKLANVKGKKIDPNNPGITNFLLDPDDTSVLAAGATYEKFDPSGSRGQWKLGGMFGPQPSNVVLRQRINANKKKFDVDPYDEIDAIERMIMAVPDNQLIEPKMDLQKDWGISFKVVGNEFQYYKIVKGKEIPYDAQGARSPQELLDNLNKSVGQTDAMEAADQIESAFVPAAKTKQPSLEALEDLDVDDQGMGVSFNDLKSALRANKDQIDEQKKDKDAGCEGPAA